jgi:HD-GYP domain-containing protein (c-di-GMP phosphodiesterase class II)
MTQDFHTIPTTSILADTVLDFDVYRRYRSGKSESHILAYARIIPVSVGARHAFIRDEINNLFVLKADIEKYRAYVERNLDLILRQKDVSEREKARILYMASELCVRDLFEDPRIGPIVVSSRDILRHVIRHVVKSEKAFHDFFDLATDSYYLFTHALNVAIYGIALLNAMGTTRADTLVAFGLGALLHDLGMREVPNSIILKPESLTRDELEVVREHPSRGVQIADKGGGIPRQSQIVVMQHHERMESTFLTLLLRRAAIRCR